MFVKVKPVIDYSVRGLCRRPYPWHPKGCPNFNYKKGCPPKALALGEVFDLCQPVFVIYNVFDFKTHVRKMKRILPGWSQAQLTCCIYWQGTARKQLDERIADFLVEHPDYRVTKLPEAMGVNITATMKKAWHPAGMAAGQCDLSGRVGGKAN